MSVYTFSILLPSWDDYRYLKPCLESLERYSAAPHEVRIHLNTYDEQLLTLAAIYDPTYTKSWENRGIAFGTNRCAERATKDFMFFPNSDMIFLPGWDEALSQAIDRYGKENVYSATMIEPYGTNENFVLKDYGQEPEVLRMDELLHDLPTYRTGKYYVKHIVPYLIPRDIFVPYDERMYPGWVTDDDSVVSIYTANPDTKFIRVQDALIYHFMMKSTRRFGDDYTRYALGQQSKKIFDEKWSRIYPQMNSENYRKYIYSDFEGASTL